MGAWCLAAAGSRRYSSAAAALAAGTAVLVASCSTQEVMKTTDIRRFTLAFIVSDGACQPVWDNGDPLTGASEEAAIRGIRAAGGEVTVSLGGNGGTKLGLTCTSPEALAGVYQ